MIFRGFQPARKATIFAESFDSKKSFVVIYAGAVGYANDIDCFVRAAKRSQDRADITFVVVGDGKELPRLQQEVADQELKNVRFVPAQAQASHAGSAGCR